MKNNVVKFDFTNCGAAQDMISIVMRDRNLSPEEAVSFAITAAHKKQIQSLGWADIAVDLWGHDDYDREWFELASPVIQVPLSFDQADYLLQVACSYEIPRETAVAYFLIFTMHDLGYHI